MKYLTATADMVDVIRNILHTTIKSVYPKYYPKEVVDFFCEYHSAEHIKEGIATGRMGMLTDGEIVVGTGCYYENEITGVYVLPEYQGKGYGTKIMDHLEKEILKGHDTVLLDASLAAVFLYEHRGYKTIGHGKYDLENGVKLVYEKMEKKR
ncbi:MAG: GNAT family N-acetyltransferase [Lachnospiraceae bacterium]|nr:GNAT family N-acetyltransferase [Lachnospiraceae bacterium]